MTRPARYMCDRAPGTACVHIPPPCCRQYPALCAGLLRRYLTATDDPPADGVLPSRYHPPRLPCPLLSAPATCTPPHHGRLLLDVLQVWGCWLHKRRAQRIAARQRIST
jgi:hypothetical protein